jgi:hypothetical protein
VLTFYQLKHGVVGRASGLDVESCDFADTCRAAVRQLMTRGNWWSDVAAVEACVCINGLLVWPRGVSTILALNVCGYPTELQNRWYRFRPLDRDCYGWGTDYQRRGWGGNLVTETIGTSPVFNQITSPGFTIRTFISNLSDVGKTITFCGIDQNGQIVRTQRTDGTWQDGEVVTLKNPFADTINEFQRVTRTVKQDTNGYLNSYQYNVAQGFLLDLAQYQPSETNPEYICTRITGGRGNFGGLGNFSIGSNGKSGVSALVKMNFVPFKYDDDPVQIDNEDAIRDMFLSIRRKEAGDLASAAGYESSAIHELNRQAETKMPDDSIVLENRTFGGALPHRRIY